MMTHSYWPTVAIDMRHNRANEHSPVITVVPLTSKICAMERYN